MIEKLIIVPVIRTDFITRCLQTLYKYTDNFQVCVVDQSIEGIPKEAFDLTHMYIRPYRNQGFAKASNLGLNFGYYQKYPYLAVVNDDVEFINNKWWQGILDTFAQDPKILAVNPMSPREATWGYGRTQDNYQTWQPPEGYAADSEDKQTMVCTINGQAYNYKESFTDAEYDNLLTSHPRYCAGSVVDAIAGWMPIFNREYFDKVGLYDEKFFPGGGEDYDIDARAYSCAWPTGRDTCNPDYHYRLVSTAKSWVWHHWGKSKDKKEELDPRLFETRPFWNNNDELWPYGFDVWGHGHNLDDSKFPYKRVPEIHIEDL